jgi:hypothetical protein
MPVSNLGSATAEQMFGSCSLAIKDSDLWMRQRPQLTQEETLIRPFTIELY